jgi:hypothetical protein
MGDNSANNAILSLKSQVARTVHIMTFVLKSVVVAATLLPLSIRGFSLSTPFATNIGVGHPVGLPLHQHFTRGTSAIEVSGEKTSREAVFEPFFVGVKRDFKRRLPLYKSDITDGINAQSLATTLFLFFACLAPAIGFGGILDVATNGAMGTIEMISSTAFCGVMYALCSAQPIQLIGPMGPVLAFTVSLAQLAKLMSLPFLPLYAWTGLWTSGMLFVSSLTSASNLVKYLTRFTDEIFSVLISAIFLFEAVSDVSRTFSSPTSTAAKALLTLTCATVTFGTSIVLKGLNKSSFGFTKLIRNNLSNFAPAIGVTVGSLVARAARLKYGSEVAGLAALSLPAKFVTTTGRPWLVPLMDLPTWARWGACLPALLATVLLFLDQNITARLVNNPRYKMEKGRDKGNVLDGMHGDMLVLSLLTAFTSMVGLPWMAGATTRSAAHARSLSLFDEDGNIKGTIENRVSGASIHALIGACVLFSTPRMLLSQVPLPVLSGVFLYLGLTSLQGLELWGRIQGLFQDSSVAPKQRWSAVPRKVTTLFTLVQVACIAAMMRVTKSSFGVVCPLIIALLPLIRFGLVKAGIISKESMDILDKD